MLTVVRGMSTEETPARLGSELHTEPWILGEQVQSFAECSAVVYTGCPWVSLFTPENWSRGLNEVATGIRTRTGMNSRVTWIVILLSSLATQLRHRLLVFLFLHEF